jgi:hypothetical protein
MGAMMPGMELLDGEIVDSHQLESLLDEIGGAVGSQIGVITGEFLPG